MERINIHVHAEQRRALDAIAKSEGVSRAKVIRRILDESLAISGRASDLAGDLDAIDAAFGILGPGERSDRKATRGADAASSAPHKTRARRR